MYVLCEWTLNSVPVVQRASRGSPRLAFCSFRFMTIRMLLMSHQVMFAGALFFCHFCIHVRVWMCVCSIHESFKKRTFSLSRALQPRNWRKWTDMVHTLNLNMAYLSCQLEWQLKAFCENAVHERRHHCLPRTKHSSLDFILLVNFNLASS